MARRCISDDTWEYSVGSRCEFVLVRLHDTQEKRDAFARVYQTSSTKKTCKRNYCSISVTGIEYDEKVEATDCLQFQELTNFC